MARQARTKTIVPPNSPERWGGVDPKPPPHFDEPKDPVLLEYVHDGRTAIITFNRPQAGNTVTTALGVRFAEIMEEIEAKVTVRCAIVTGAGQDFCRGADLRERKAMDSEQWLRQRRAFDRTLHTLRNMRRPIFAAVNGRAVGGGSEFAQSCDFIIAAENASFCQPEALVGISAGGGSTWFLPRQLSPGHAMYQLMTGEPVSAQDAYRMGMVVRLCPPAELMNLALEIAGEDRAKRTHRAGGGQACGEGGAGRSDGARDDHQPGVPLEIRPPSGPWRRGQGLERDARAELQ